MGPLRLSDGLGISWEEQGLNGVGQGFVLAGRYRLEERLQADSSGSQWRAVDQTLEREVVVRVVDASHPRAEDILDAARRVALADDPRLVRILDVGSERLTDGHVTYIISEDVVGRPLTEVVTSGPLPAETARRLVGEASQALARAGSRGLHHLQLDPSTVFVTADGSVKVAGTAVTAAVEGIDPETSQAAEHTDTVGLVSLLYCAITGRWPGTSTPKLGAAPLVNGRAVPPRDLVAGVPSDLDTLCSVALGPDDSGPRSPAELAEELAPWARSAPLTDPRGLAIGSPDRPPAPPAPKGGRSAPTGEVAQQAATPETPVTPMPSGRSASPRHPRRPSEPPGVLPAAADRGRWRFGQAGVPTPTNPTPAADRSGPVPVSSTGTAGTAGTAATAAAAGAAGPAGPPQTPQTSKTPQTPPAPQARQTPQAAPAPTPAQGPAVAQPGPQQPVDLFRPANEVGAAPGYQDAPFGVVGTAAGSGPWTGFGTPSDGEEYLGPFLPPAPLTRPPQDQSQLVLIVVAAVVVVGLVIALWSLRDYGGGSDDAAVPGPVPSVTATPTPSATTSPSAAASESTTPEPTPTPSLVPAISGLRALDPLGDGEENDDLLSRAQDGKEGTAWKSSRYRTTSFGGLKTGLGLAVQLEQTAPVTEVRITGVRGSGGTFELRTADGPEFDGSSVVAKASSEDGEVVLRPPSPATTEFLVIWITKLPRVNGQGQAFVAEITVK